jgi:hypothetical protein
MQRPHKSALPLAMAAVATGAVLPAAVSAETSRGCVVPDVIGVKLSNARQALSASGCQITIRQLPAHGKFVTPAAPDGRQLVGRQRPSSGDHSRSVTVWVKPLCAQPAFPGPSKRGPTASRGPAELIAGLYLQGGPTKTGPHCRRAVPEAGTLVVSTPAGEVVARRQVQAGKFGVFPLPPGSYVLGGTIEAGTSSSARQVPQTAVTIAAKRTTRLNVVADVS